MSKDLYFVSVNVIDKKGQWKISRSAIASSTDIALCALRDEIRARFSDLPADDIVDSVEADFYKRKTWGESKEYCPQNSAPVFFMIETVKEGVFCNA